MVECACNRGGSEIREVTLYDEACTAWTFRAGHIGVCGLTGYRKPPVDVLCLHGERGDDKVRSVGGEVVFGDPFGAGAEGECFRTVIQ